LSYERMHPMYWYALVPGELYAQKLRVPTAADPTEPSRSDDIRRKQQWRSFGRPTTARHS